MPLPACKSELIATRAEKNPYGVPKTESVSCWNRKMALCFCFCLSLPPPPQEIWVISDWCEFYALSVCEFINKGLGCHESFGTIPAIMLSFLYFVFKTSWTFSRVFVLNAPSAGYCVNYILSENKTAKEITRLIAKIPCLYSSTTLWIQHLKSHIFNWVYCTYPDTAMVFVGELIFYDINYCCFKSPDIKYALSFNELLLYP